MRSEPASSAVVASDVTIRYGGRRAAGQPNAVDGVSLTVPRGGILAVVGEAGSGKSTLARAVAGQLGGDAGAAEITGGSLRVLGTELRDAGRRTLSRLSLRVGYMPQDAGSRLEPHLTIGENVAQPIYLRDRRFDQREAGIAVATMLDLVRLPLGVMNRFPHELSRGQQQRVALARSLILEPELLVADDPTMGVDVIVRGPILEVLRDIQRERDFSALVIGQDLREIRRMTERIAVLHRGVLVGLGSVDEVLGNPNHPYVESLARAVSTGGAA